MTDPAKGLMLTGVVQWCADCRAERIFVPTDDCGHDRCEFCCTTCGAAVVVDPLPDARVLATRAA